MYISLLICILIQICLFCSCKSEFDPYRNNAGTVVGIAGDRYCVLASDTRLSEGYMIHSRNKTRLGEILPGMILCGSGCLADTDALLSTLRHNSNVYQWQAKEQISIEATSHLLSAIMYSRRMFPYYSFSILGGLDKEGHGALYRYDAIGSFERVKAVCAGRGEKLIMPALDCLTDMEADEGTWKLLSDENVFESVQPKFVDISIDEAVTLIVDAFRSAAEREISIGDGLDIIIVERQDRDNMMIKKEKIDNQNQNQRIEKRRMNIRRLHFALPHH
jgi:20S proteasome subunit beta 6